MGTRGRVTAGLCGALLLGVVAGGCAGTTETPPVAAFTPPPRVSTSASAAASEEIPDSPVAGIVTSVDSTGISEVKGFKLHTVAGEDLTFRLGTLENGDEFPPGHLSEHMAAAAPVLVYFRDENGVLVVYRIEDAG